MTTSTSLNDLEEIYRYYSDISSANKDKIDRAWADAIINDGLPFTKGTSDHWDKFFKVAFGGACKPPYRQTTSGPVLDISYDQNLVQVMDLLKSFPSIYTSVDGFSDVN